MNWLEIAAIALVCLGLFAGAFLFARRPEFWIELGARLIQRLAPLVWQYVSRRMSESDEKAWRECMLKNGRWNHQKRRCE